ncbi:MAG: hypothetical protein AMXMBFR59_21140 [Rhodanobacteraceae bacterium]
MDRDGLLGAVALLEIVTLEHPRHGVLGSKLDHVCSRHLTKPFGIEADFGSFAIEHLEHLLRISRGVRLYVRTAQWLACRILARGIADHAGEVANQEYDLMSEILKLAHLVQQDGMAQMEIRRSRIEAGFDAKRSTELQSRLEVFPLDDLFRAATNEA